jgi:hypothetical protein
LVRSQESHNNQQLTQSTPGYHGALPRRTINTIRGSA